MAAHRIYLDYNATAPLRPEARAAMGEALDAGGNPSSVHGEGRQAKRRLEEAREALAQCLEADPAGITFTSGATEANAIALAGAQRRGDAVLVSAIEHPSVLQNAPEAPRIAVDAQGRLDLAALAAQLAGLDRPPFLSLMLVNNETGVVQPVAEAAALLHRHGGLLHCDAVQGFGRIPLSCTALGADLLTLSAHKLGGPPGAGALIRRAGLEWPALWQGGGQEKRARAGTENLPAIAGFAAAAKATEQALQDGEAERLRALTARLETSLSEACPELVIFGAETTRSGHTSQIAVPGWPSEQQVMALDLAGFAISAGSACSSGKVAQSHVLTAMGADPALARCAIRISLGWRSTEADIDAFCDAWRTLYQRTGRIRAA